MDPIGIYSTISAPLLSTTYPDEQAVAYFTIQIEVNASQDAWFWGWTIGG